MASISLLPLRDIDPVQRQAVLSLQISPEQVEYAGTVERAIVACESAPEDQVAGLAILHGRKPVGFVVLSRGSKLPDWAPAGSAALTAMRIDRLEQGKGHGKAALALLTPWLVSNWPETHEVALLVDDANQAGRRAYAAAGFSEYTDPKPGRIGMVRYMSKTLAAAQSEA